MGKTIVVTGASDGIGAAAARRLRADGHEVVVVGRSADKTRAVAEELGTSHFVVDFAELAQVRALAETLIARYPRIDVLANNAGGIFGERTLTVDRFEKTFQVNHLAPFLLTNLLLEVLLESGATVVNTSSSAARIWGRLDLDDVNHERHYNARRAYGDSKLANIVFTRELHRRFHERGLSSAAFHPGLVATNFGSESSGWIRLAFQTPAKRLLGMVTPGEGAEELVWLAETAPGAGWTSGEFYARHRVKATSPQAADAELAVRLWEQSSAMVGLEPGGRSSD